MEINLLQDRNQPEQLMEAELCFPRLLNASCLKVQRSDVEILLTNVLVSSISLLTAFLNLLVIVSISHFKQLHSPTNLLLLSLAVSDFFMGLFMFFQIEGCWSLGNLVCVLCQYLVYIISSVSVGTMVLISVDRYVAVCYPLHYSITVTQTRVQVCVCLCWICSMVYQGLYLMENLHQPGRFNSCVGECVIVINYAAGLADVMFSFVVPITVIVVLYLRVFVVAVTQARSMRSHAAVLSVAPSSVQRSELKAARKLGVLVGVFLTCLCPYYCVSLTRQDPAFSVFAVYLYYLNSSLNPLIYALFYPWFRRSVKLIVTFRILQPDSGESSM